MGGARGRREERHSRSSKPEMVSKSTKNDLLLLLNILFNISKMERCVVSVLSEG